MSVYRMRTWFGKVEVHSAASGDYNVTVTDELIQKRFKFLVPECDGIACTHCYLFLLTKTSLLCFRTDSFLDSPLVATLDKASTEFLQLLPSSEDFVILESHDDAVNDELDALPRGCGMCIAATDRRLFLADSRDGVSWLYKVFDEETYVDHKLVGPVLLQTPQSSAVRFFVRDKMSAGHDHVLILDKNGHVFAFGTGSHGELGIGAVGSESEPVAVLLPEDIRVIDISAGGWHSLARTESNDVYAWGWNHQQQLGRDLEDCVFDPAPLELDDVVDISAYGSCSLFVTRDQSGNEKRLKYGRFFAIETEI